MIDSKTLARFAGIGEKRAATALTLPTDQPADNQKLQDIVGQADDAVSAFAQFHPQLGPGQLANPFTPFQGDDAFFLNLLVGARFAAHDSSWWEITEYTNENTVGIQNVWYPRQSGVVSIQTVRKSIAQWIHPIQVTVPPMPEGVDYGIQETRIVP